MKKIWAMLTALALVCAMLPSAMAVDLNKEASGLTNNKTTVTLTVGADQTTEAADVVFVLDKSTSTDVREEALKMLKELQKEASERNLKVKVGAVVFNRSADNEGYVVDLSELDDDTVQSLTKMFGLELASGTNIEAGLRKGISMLQSDSDVPNSNKHLVLVSDGITYIWGANEPVKSIYSQRLYDKTAAVDNIMWLSSCEMDPTALEDLSAWYDDTTIKEEVQRLLGSYETNYTSGTISKSSPGYEELPAIPSGGSNLTALEVAMYKTIQAWESADKAGYNLYAYATQNSDYSWGPIFIENLKDIAGSSSKVPDNVSGMFDGVKNSILYEIQSGTVKDPIGYYYTFDGLDTVKLTVGGVEVEQDDPAVGYNVSFNNGAYGVNYDETNRVLTWDIKTPVEQGKAVALSYGLTVDQSKVPTDRYVDAPTNGETTLTYEPTTGGKEIAEFDVPEFTLGKKESIPTPDKEANGNESIGDVAPGQTISFTIKTSLPETIVETDADEPTMLIFRDTMTGLELVDGTIALTINGKTIPADYYDFEDMSTANPKYLESGNTFALAVDLSAIHASEEYGPLANLGAGSVVLSYQGKVTAGMGSEVNNEAWVNDSNSDTTPGKVTITTGGSGTLMYTIGGAVLLAAAGALFVVNRRKTAG